MQIFKKEFQKALNRILTLPNYSTGPGLLISSGIIDLQNNWFCEYFKHCKFRISVPMSYISFWQLHICRPQGPFGSYILTIWQFRGFVFVILASFLTESDFQGSFSQASGSFGTRVDITLGWAGVLVSGYK